MAFGSKRVKHAYFFVAATTPLDQQLAKRVFSVGSQQLRNSSSTFRSLFDQVEKKSSALTIGAGRTPSIDNLEQTFQTWLQTRNINIKNIQSLYQQQIFFASGEDRPPLGGGSYWWATAVYFELG
ncbi:MAG: hypothetical protein HXX08_18965 [Chloroflexi bacterium]|uniref:Uncharacterized protein n=1 Tax=Candidatus Chlorohelix allophototropha TaxID=3003348 RepID=A0A8T7M712_9CHLR|nr:hypothetical protein [Chloroflexota bacterium]WJW69845.1 hypothetical protein OZ401_003475 [Chloroflexota bacterium L227-S17]